jgi:hypothetical protein
MEEKKMIEMDALQFYFILEFIGALMLIIGIMYVTTRKYRKGSKDKNFENLIKKDIESLENQIKTFDDKTSAHFDKEAVIANEIDSTKLNIANTALDALHGEKNTMESFWYHLFDNKLDKIVKGRLNHFLNAASSFASTVTQEEHQKLKDALSKLKKDAIGLMGYKEMFIHTLKEFRKIKNTNETIIKSFEKAGTTSNEVNKAISECKSLNTGLDRCIEVLLKKQETDVNGSDGYETHGSLGTESDDNPMGDISSKQIKPEVTRTIEGLQKNKKFAEEKIKELEEILKKKEEDYCNLENDYNQLQVEYTNVFKQHKGETGWTSKAL